VVFSNVRLVFNDYQISIPHTTSPMIPVEATSTYYAVLGGVEIGILDFKQVFLFPGLFDTNKK